MCLLAQPGFSLAITNPGHGIIRENTEGDRGDLCKETVGVGDGSPTDLAVGRWGELVGT